ncbi:MAG TPA: hypothetical protein VM100_05760 [Longimicrobiales bacterium]|nr:hypothetical protein [Longimicrobiales bacterium]
MQPDTTPEKNETKLSFFEELRERGVLKMAAWYVASSLVTIQIVQTVQQAFYLSPMVLTSAVVLAMGGFPIALLLSWHFDITPGGTNHNTIGDARQKTASDWRVITISAIAIIAVAGVAFYVSPARNVLAARRSPRILCAGGGIAPCRVETTMDANRFVVLPLAHDVGVEPKLLNGEICARLLGDGLSQWQDMKMADPLRLAEALARLAPEMRMSIPVDSGVVIARELGAGKLIMGRLTQINDSTRVEAILYNAQRGEAVNRATGVFASGSKEAAGEFARLARKLVIQDGDLAVGEPVAYATTSYKALFAYDSAWKAVRDWKIDDADRYFRSAIFHDANFAYAHLWLAYVMLWQDKTNEQWLQHTRDARGDSAQLDPQNRLLARGIAALAEGKYTEACDNYNAAIARDSANFHAWFGLGECLAQDRRVVRDAKSPSGWSFASSHEAAIRAHHRALQLVPAFNQVFANLGSSRFAGVLYVFANQRRSGVNDAGQEFSAFPELIGDTTAFIPYPHEGWASRPRPLTQLNLVERHRAVLRKSAEEWAAAYPKSPRALEAYALALEQAGDIQVARGHNSALSLLDAARRLETDSSRQMRMDVAKVRLLFKVEDYRAARKMAKRVLRDEKLIDAKEAQRFAGIAGLIGRPHQMGRILVTAGNQADEFDGPRSGGDVELPQDLVRTAAKLLAFTYFGGPQDSIQTLFRDAHLIVGRERDVTKRSALHQATLDRAARMLFNTRAPDEVYKSDGQLTYYMDLQRQMLSNNVALVRDSLHALVERQKSMKPGDISADGIMVEARLMLAVGDTAAATRLLDGYLGNMHDLATSHFRQAWQPVTLVRLMQLRAELAVRGGDSPAARKWSRAVIDLWSDGEPDATPTLRRMRKIAHLR